MEILNKKNSMKSDGNTIFPLLFIFKFILLKYGWFTIVCYFLLYTNMVQLYIAI